MPKTRVLTLKQKKFVQEYVRNRGNGTQAVLASYDQTEESAGVTATRLLRSASVQEELAKVLDANGLTTPDIASKLSQAINSGLLGKATMADALRGLELAIKAKNLMPASRSISTRLDIKYDGLDFKSLKKELSASQEKNKELLAE